MNTPQYNTFSAINISNSEEFDFQLEDHQQVYVDKFLISNLGDIYRITAINTNNEDHVGLFYGREIITKEF
jgi:hypothetical protein